MSWRVGHPTCSQPPRLPSPAGSWQTIRLPPSFVSDSNFVTVAVSWMSDPVLRRGYLYLSYKLARLAEAGLPKELDAHVHVSSRRAAAEDDGMMGGLMSMCSSGVVERPAVDGPGAVGSTS